VKTRIPETIVIIPEKSNEAGSLYKNETAAEISMDKPSIINTRLKTLAIILKLIIPDQVKNFVRRS
jgi:hypothetical protein